MAPQVDFDIADSILRVLEGRELGNRGLYTKYRAYKKIIKISRSYFGPGSPKKRFSTIFRDFLRKKSPEIRKSWPETLESRVGRPGNLE